MTKEALIIIDVQNDFLPGGALAVPDGDAIFPHIETLAGNASTIVMTQDWHPAGHKSFASAHAAPAFTTTRMPYGEQMLWPDHCVQGSTGAIFAPIIAPVALRADMILRKGMNPEIDSYSAFFENDRATPSGLAGWLFERDISRIRLAGLALDYCVGFSALDAARIGFSVIVETQACRGITAEGVEAMTARMRKAGVVIS